MPDIDYSKYTSIVLPDTPDDRDYIYTATSSPMEQPFSYINPNIGEIEHQYQSGSCVANSCVSSLEMMAPKDAPVNLSRLFLYYNVRKDYPSLHLQDKGAYTRDAYKYANRYGICSESTWAFDLSKIHDKPSEESYKEALTNKVLKYERILVKDTGAIKSAILENRGVIFGMSMTTELYNMPDSFEEQNYTGVSTTKPQTGGHAMSIVGYDDKLGGFIVENSWGKRWGNDGLFLLNYSVFAADTHDVWTCQEVTFNPDYKIVEPAGFFEKVIKYFRYIKQTIINYVTSFFKK